MKKFLTLKDIQYEATKMLEQVLDFFDNNKITYYIYAGSFLGAVRHKGFIPWDDDIDLAVPRPDYEKLKKILLKDNRIAKNIFGIGYELGIDDWPFIKIINDSIVIDEQEKADKHLWIDIFPLDGFPENKSLYLKVLNFIRNIYFYKRASIIHKKCNDKSIIKKVKKATFNFLLAFVNYNIAIKLLIKYSSKYNYEESKYVKNNIWSSSDSCVIDKSNMDFDIYDFEGLKVNGFKDYDYYLSKWYGDDYMQLPPKNKRVTHSFKAWKVEENEKNEFEK